MPNNNWWIVWDFNAVKSIIAITWEDSFWESFSTCKHSVPFSAISSLAISDNRRIWRCTSTSFFNPQLSAISFQDPVCFFLAHYRLLHSQQPLLPCWCPWRNQHVWSQPLRLGCCFFQHLFRYLQRILQFTDLRAQRPSIFFFWCCKKKSHFFKYGNIIQFCLLGCSVSCCWLLSLLPCTICPYIWSKV